MYKVVRRCVVLAAVGLVVLTGCSKTIDEAKLQDTIRDKVAADQGITLTSVSCPKDRKAKTGDIFQCTATTDSGATITFDVTQTSDNGDVKYDSKDVYIPPAGLTTSIQEAATSSADVQVTATCPKAVVAPGGNGQIECQVKASTGETQTVVVPISNNTADVSKATIKGA